MAPTKQKLLLPSLNGSVTTKQRQEAEEEEEEEEEEDRFPEIG